MRLMSQKKKNPTPASLSDDICKMLVPSYILADFEVHSVCEQKEYWIIELLEKEEKIPLELSSYSDVVLDGYCNAIEIQSNTFALMKAVYLRCYRRRWKRSKETKHYSNSYSLTTPGVKMVKELGAFLKG